MNEATAKNGVEHGGALAKACAEFGGMPADWLDLSTGINPNPVPLPKMDASVWARLPDDDLFERASVAAASRYGAAGNVKPLPVAGTQSVIQLLPSLFDGDVAILGPTYEEYRARFQRAGRTADVISDVAQLSANHRLVVVINPNNPNGRILSRETIVALAERLSRNDGYLIVDEAFADLHPEESVADLAGKLSNLIVFRSFGKFFGLAGLRLGFVLATPQLLRRIRVAQGPWAVSGPALEIASRVLSDQALCAGLREQIAGRHDALDGILAGAGLTVAGGTRLFVLVDDERAAQLHRGLCERRILTRKFSYTPRWLRIGLCPDEADDNRLRVALAQVLAELG